MWLGLRAAGVLSALRGWDVLRFDCDRVDPRAVRAPRLLDPPPLVQVSVHCVWRFRWVCLKRSRSKKAWKRATDPLLVGAAIAEHIHDRSELHSKRSFLIRQTYIPCDLFANKHLAIIPYSISHALLHILAYHTYRRTNILKLLQAAGNQSISRRFQSFWFQKWNLLDVSREKSHKAISALSEEKQTRRNAPGGKQV